MDMGNQKGQGMLQTDNTADDDDGECLSRGKHTIQHTTVAPLGPMYLPLPTKT